MTDIYNYPYIGLDGAEGVMTLCSGPVVIHEDKVLLHISDSTGKYQFIGGRLNDKLSMRENALERAEAVLGHRDLILGDTPLSVIGEIERDGKIETVVLFHYKAVLTDLDHIGAGEWKTLDEIEQLSHENMLSSNNVIIASKHFLLGECLIHD
ncbi:hypothetical protein N9J72_00825 [Candidatus Gracilibacteria bacterium]|nr:hypothetical protein [Candidatus Gracilibacteria bacterium]